MRIVKVALAIVLTAACAGCETHGNIDPKAAVQSENDSYFVMGLQPAFTRMALADGTVENGKFAVSKAVRAWGINVPFEGEPEDGYIVGKVPGDTILGLHMVQLHQSKWGLAPAYWACESVAGGSADERQKMEEAKRLVFTVPRHTVIYIANLYFARSDQGQTAGARYSTDLEGARAFLKAHYPALADRLVQGSYELMPFAPC